MARNGTTGDSLSRRLLEFYSTGVGYLICTVFGVRCSDK